METGNPEFTGPAGFQGRQLQAVILAVMVPDTQTPPWVAAASCPDFQMLTKETVGWYCHLISPTQAAAADTCTGCLCLVFLFSVQEYHNLQSGSSFLNIALVTGLGSYGARLHSQRQHAAAC